MEKRDPSIFTVIPVRRFFSQASGMGGHVTHFVGIAGALRSSGLRVRLFCEETHSVAENCTDSVHILPARNSGILAHLSWCYRFAKFVAAAADQTRPLFVYVRYSAKSSLFLPALKRMLKGTPIILEVNSIGGQQYPCLKPVERWAMAAADVITTISPEMECIVKQMLGRNNDGRIVIIENGVDCERFRMSPISSHHFGPVKIGYTGILKDAGYGLKTLLDAFRMAKAKYTNLSLDIYGDGPHCTALKHYASKMMGVQFHGAVKMSEIPRILSDLDIVVNSNSNWHMSPIKLYEYMAAGKAIISARAPTASRLLQNGNLGLLYDPGDSQTLCQQILTLASDPAMRTRLGLAVRQEANDKHRWEFRILELRTFMASKSIVSEPTRLSRSIIPLKKGADNDRLVKNTPPNIADALMRYNVVSRHETYRY